jgi:hypothetical protein
MKLYDLNSELRGPLKTRSKDPVLSSSYEQRHDDGTCPTGYDSNNSDNLVNR